jgi:hypothetical protein
MDAKFGRRLLLTATSQIALHDTSLTECFSFRCIFLTSKTKPCEYLCSSVVSLALDRILNLFLPLGFPGGMFRHCLRMQRTNKHVQDTATDKMKRQFTSRVFSSFCIHHAARLCRYFRRRYPVACVRNVRDARAIELSAPSSNVPAKKWLRIVFGTSKK